MPRTRTRTTRRPTPRVLVVPAEPLPENDEVRPSRPAPDPRRAHWYLQHRGEWIAAWGVMSTLTFAGAITIWVAYETPRDHLPIWPAFLFAAGALVSLYMVFAPVFHWRPFPRPRDPSDIADSLTFVLSEVAMAVRNLEKADRTWSQVPQTPAARDRDLAAQQKAEEALAALRAANEALQDEISKQLGASELLAMLAHGTRMVRPTPDYMFDSHSGEWGLAQASLDWVATRVSQLTASAPL